MIIDNKLLDEITLKADASPRLRMNFNLHDSLDAKAQRLINVLLPGTNLPKHKHNHSSETYIILRGKMSVIFYDDNANETARFDLDPAKGHYGVQIPAGQWHGVEVTEPTAIFEVKDGPYTPLTPDDILDK